MKSKKEIKKFNLEKFEVAKLSNMKVIKGGSDSGIGGNDETNTVNQVRTFRTGN